MFVAPAPGLPYSRIHEAEAFGIDAATARKMGAVESLEGMIRVVPQLHERGVRGLPGGDYGFPYNPIGRNARDLELFVELFGFTPVEALVAATRHGGELMGLAVGQIRPGYLADLIVLDLGLPDRDGLTVVRRVRRDATTPILILSARAEEADKVAALEAGADDYVTKPFGMAELRARIAASKASTVLSE